MAADASTDLLAGRIVIGIDRLAQNLAQAGKAVDGFVSRASSTMARLATSWQSVGNQLKSIADAASRSMLPLQAGLGNVTKAVTGLGVAAGGASMKLISLASDANEAASKFGFVFKDAADKTGKSLDAFAEKAGRSRYAMRNMAADIGALIQPMGFTREKTGELSTAVAKLAVDLSSFFNVSENDALIALKAGIVGESEPLRRLGVNLNEAKIQQEAFRLGIAKTKDEVNGAIKTQAILSLVFKETQQAQGDAIRTSDQFANSLRRARDFIKDAATDLGQSLIPAATRYVNAVGDAAQPVSVWAKENQKLLEQRVDVFLERVSDFAGKLGESFKSLWASTERLRGSVADLGEKFKGVYDKGKSVFDGLPKWAQDLIMVGGAVTGLSIGLGTLGGSIPIVGQFAIGISNLINPVGILKGLFEVVYPLATAVGGTLFSMIGGAFTPLGVAVVAAGATFIGLVDSIRKALDVSETAQASWETIKETFGRISEKIGAFIDDCLKVLYDWWEKNGEQFERIQVKVGELALVFGEKLAGAMEALVDKALPFLKDSLVSLGETFHDLMDIAEAYVDFFSGDGRRSTVLFNSVIIELNKTLLSVLETVGEIVGGFDKFAGTDFAGGIKKQISAIKMENGLRETANSILSDSIAEDDRARGSKKALKSAIGDSGIGSGIGAIFGGGKVDADTIKQVTKAQEQAKTEYKQQNASQVAQSDAKVASAAGAESGAYNVNVKGGVEEGSQFKKPMTAKEKADQKKKDQEQAAAAAKAQASFRATQFIPVEAGQKGGAPGQEFALGTVSKQQANKNLAADIKQNRASDNATLQAVRQNVQGQSGGQQQLQMIFQQLQKAQQLQAQALEEENAERRKALLEESDMRRQAANAMVQANQDGVKGIKGLADAAKNAGVDMDKLDQAEKDRIAKENGQPTAAQQQAMAQQQQFAQQFQQGFMQAAQNAAQQQGQAMQEGAQAMLEQALGGPGQVQAMIDEATSKGDMKAAYALIRQRLEAQLKVSMSNLHNLASDPMAGGGFGPEHGGQSNDAYFMTLDIPLVRMIKFLKAQLDHLPKMAMGGIVTGARNVTVGEAGPEAVLPLTKFSNMLGALPVFTGIQNAMERLGDFFSNIGPGNNPALSRQYFANLLQAQQTFEYTADTLRNSRRINFSPGSYQQSYAQGYGGMAGIPLHGAMASRPGLNISQIHLNLNGVDLASPNSAMVIAQNIFPAIEAEANRLGYDTSGRSVIRSGGNATRRGVGYAR